MRSSDASGPGPSAAVGGFTPLSYAQEGIWLASRLNEGGADFHNLLAIRLQGELRVDALEAALTRIAQRHDILRCVFSETNGQLGQRPLPPTDVHIARVDIPAEVAAAGWQSAGLETYLDSLAATPFDLAAAPAWRCHLAALGSNDHILAVTFHHIVADAVTSELFAGELASFYADVNAALPAPQQYQTFASTERDGRDAFAAHLPEWIEHLATASRSVTLPRPAAGEADPAPRRRFRFTIDAPLTTAIDALARSAGGSLFNAFAAALAVSLSRLGGDDDLSFGIFRTTRGKGQLQRMFGVLVDSQVLRIDLRGAQTLPDLIAQIRTRMRWGFDRPVPFGALTRALASTHADARDGLFDVGINFAKVPTAGPIMPGLTTAIWRLAGSLTSQQLTLEVNGNNGALECLLDYDTRRVARSSIEQIAEAIPRLLGAAATTPEQPIAALPSVPAAVLEARLREQPRGTVTTGHETSVTALFAARVRTSPGSLAVRDQHGDCTAVTLDERANRLAHYLIRQGAGPGTRVAICLPRSTEFVAAALAVMKAGAAFVPIDPEYPDERVRLIAEVSDPACVVTTSANAGRVPHQAMIVLDRDRDAIAAEPATAPATSINADTPAYVLFTSGSTGTPRGVVGLHRGIVNRILWMQRTYPFAADDVCAQKTAVGFVDSIWEIFGALTCGTPLVVIPDAAIRDARAFVGALSAHGVTRLVLVPSLLEAILDTPIDLASALQRLRLCISSGETLSPRLAERCLSRLPAVTWLNLYGTSEVAADVTCAHITSAAIRDAVSIGTPIDNVTIYLLDRARQPVARGDIGEIYVGGVALAAGYLGDDAATAERFIVDPIIGERIFKTGDLGRVRDTGEIEVIGRVDHQLKILGRRIEPGEIESVLRTHASVRQVTVVRNQARGVLAAYVVPHASTLDAAELQAFASRRLPDYMVPALFVSIQETPLTPHGKIDRARLAARDEQLDRVDAVDTTPATPLEQTVAEIWTEVLGVTPQSMTQDFVALGGHSLRATALVWRVRERLGVELSPATVLKYPTIRTFATEVARHAASGVRGLPAIVPIDRSGRLRASAAQRQLWLESRMQDERATNLHLGAFLLSGALDTAALDRSLARLVERHESLRTICRLDGDDLIMAPLASTEVTTPIEDLSRVPEADRMPYLHARLRAEHGRRFDLTRDLPFRARLFRLAPNRHAISLALHHSAFDGWSITILLRELREFYRSECRHTSPALSPLSVQYADFAAWQRGCLDSGAFAAQRDYWRRRLADAPTELDLPYDRQSDAQPRMGRHRIVLDERLTAAVRECGQREGATLFTTLCSGYAALLAWYTGQSDLIIGTAAANRRLPAVEPLIGAFVNPVALRFTLDVTQGFTDLVRAARAIVTDAFDNQDLPFDVVAADLTQQRQSGRSELFQTMFAMQDRGGWHLDLDGVESSELDTVPAIASVPLTLVLHEQGHEVRGHFEYRADLFDGEIIGRLADNYLSLLRRAASAPTTSLAALSHVGGAELEHLHACEGTIGPEPQWARIERVFETHALQTPDAPALATIDGEHSYREIDQRARHLAARLIALGVSPGQVVAITMPRSVPLYVAMLGVLQAGAAFVIVDPQQPPDRSAFIIDDSGAAVVITTGDATSEDGLLLTATETHRAAISAAVDTDAVACLVYTSGSSGQPKGVRITHRNIAAMSDAWCAVTRLHRNSRAAQMVSPAFDVALADIFATWSRGACLCPLDPADSLPGRGMVTALARLGVTHWTIPPSLLAECPAMPWPELQAISVGGEPPAPDVLARWGRGRVLTLYGLTEGTVASTGEVFIDGVRPTIGKPFPGVQATIVNALGDRVPIGAAGELVIAGAQVADGYHRRAELTTDRFFDVGGVHHFKTGDRARWRHDGRIDFLGRIDRQLKYHGYRIEPGEIEAATRRHPAVEQAFVTVRDIAAGDTALVAYVVRAGNARVTESELRVHWRAHLPPTMCPSAVVFLDALPRTSTGKIDARALPLPQRETHAPAPVAPATSTGHTESLIAAIWRDLLGHDQFSHHDNFFDAGGHSLMAVRMHERLTTHFGDAISVVDVFAHPTIAALARHIGGAAVSMPVAAASLPGVVDRRIAIIGMACRYPRSDSVETLWRNLVDGVECLRRLTDEELRAAGVDETAQADPRFVPVAGVLDGIDRFDAEYFGYRGAEARLLDPQQRLLLELAQQAIESAGYDPQRYQHRIGVFAGVGFNAYLHRVLFPNGLPATSEGFGAVSANDKDFAASQIAYRLNLRGPAITVQTACSTSLVAVDVAIQSLLSGRCEMALAGGVSIRVPHHAGYRHEDGMILSPDGHCRPFDAAAAGTVASDGGGIVLLKRLAAAIADGDHIDAVILGSASNNDGDKKVGFTAPSVEGQAQVIRDALAAAGVEPESIRYVEAHGTGTSLGDPVEIEALHRAYGDSPAPSLIGSIKSNLGHTDTAAGVAGLIKAALAVQRDCIPPSLHFATPNPRIDFRSGRWVVSDRAQAFPASPRRAAVSAFGIGGTNAHVILEQPPAAQSTASAPNVILPLSARSEHALRQVCRDLTTTLTAADASLGDIAFTLQHGRRIHDHRHAIAVTTATDAIAAFEARSTGAGAWPRATARGTAWLFSGQGTQRPGMGRAVYEDHAVVRDWIDRGAESARPYLGIDLRDLICRDGDAIHETRFAQPALFTLQYALAQAWLTAGVTPSALIGHSVGEFAAACMSGIFAFDDAMRIVCERGRLMHQCPGGAMLAVHLDESSLHAEIEAAACAIDIAAINGPRSCVVAGTEAAIDGFAARLRAAGISARRLETQRAFHSRLMAPIEDEFERIVGNVPRSAGNIPIVSTLTGDWLTDDEAIDPGRWRRQLRDPVRFAAAVRALEAREPYSLLEIGPDRTLATLSRGLIEDPDRCITSSAPALNDAIARLWGAGVEIDWQQTGQPRGRRVPLPTYPFERVSHWGSTASSRPTAATTERPLDEWFFNPSWYRAPAPAAQREMSGTRWLIIGDPESPFVASLRNRGANVTLLAGDADAADTVRASQVTDVVLISGAVSDRNVDTAAIAEQRLDAVTCWLQALGARTAPANFYFVTRDTFDVIGNEPVQPWSAAAAGVIKVAPYEYPHIRCRHIDATADVTVDALISEICASVDDATISLRGAHRWIPGLQPIAIGDAPVFRDGGAYLITGGFGGVGLTLASHLGTTFRANVALVGRHGASDDPRWLAARESIERAGGSVHAYAADVADITAMGTAIADFRRRCGAIHGCIHAAGVVDRAGVLPRRTREAMLATTSAKVRGTVVLHELLREERLDFLVLCSTLGSILPQAKIGQTGYSAGNEFLDAYAAYARRLGVPATTINWDDWGEVGMSVTAAREATAERRPTFLGPHLTPAQGVQVFARLAGSPHARIVVSRRPPHDLPRQLAEMFAGPARTIAAAGDPAAALAMIWGDALGVSQVGADDNFFMLGGHSLMAIQILSKVRDTFEVSLPLAGFLEQPTLAHQRQALERALAKQALASVSTASPDTGDDWTL